MVFNTFEEPGRPYDSPILNRDHFSTKYPRYNRFGGAYEGSRLDKSAYNSPLRFGSSLPRQFEDQFKDSYHSNYKPSYSCNLLTTGTSGNYYNYSKWRDNGLLRDNYLLDKYQPSHHNPYHSSTTNNNKEEGALGNYRNNLFRDDDFSFEVPNYLKSVDPYSPTRGNLGHYSSNLGYNSSNLGYNSSNLGYNSSSLGNLTSNLDNPIRSSLHTPNRYHNTLKDYYPNNHYKDNYTNNFNKDYYHNNYLNNDKYFNPVNKDYYGGRKLEGDPENYLNISNSPNFKFKPHFYQPPPLSTNDRESLNYLQNRDRLEQIKRNLNFHTSTNDSTCLLTPRKGPLLQSELNREDDSTFYSVNRNDYLDDLNIDELYNKVKEQKKQLLQLQS